MFGPSKTLKPTSNRTGQPPRAGQAHSQDPGSLGTLPAYRSLLPPQHCRKFRKCSFLPQVTLQMPNLPMEEAGPETREWNTPWNDSLLFVIGGATSKMTTSNVEMATSPGCVVISSQPTHLLGPWTDLGAGGILETKIVVWRKGFLKISL